MRNERMSAVVSAEISNGGRHVSLNRSSCTLGNSVSIEMCAAPVVAYDADQNMEDKKKLASVY